VADDVVKFAVPASQDKDRSGSQTLRFNAAVDGPQTSCWSKTGVKALVHKAVEGFTSTAFAYGQTGSGKTYSLLGPEENVCLLADDSCTEQNLPPACLECIDEVRKAKVGEQGLLPRAAQFLFTLLDDDAEVRVSFLELYNEKVYDLLAESGAALGEFISVVARRQRLAGLTIPPFPEVRQRPKPGIGFNVPNLTTIECGTVSEVLELLRSGMGARRTSSHALNKQSSRSHAIFTIHLPAADGGESGGKLVFADLAGSERQKRATGTNTKETANINKSLFALSNSISALSSGKKGNYRDSNLTKLLMESLDGGGYCLLLATISPVRQVRSVAIARPVPNPLPQHFDETANTLFFASKSANIKKRATVNETAHEKQVRELKALVAELRGEIAALKAGNGANGGAAAPARAGDAAALADAREALRHEREKNAALEDMVARLRADHGDGGSESETSSTSSSGGSGRRRAGESKSSSFRLSFVDVRGAAGGGAHDDLFDDAVGF
jgi:hypothetical protein